MLSELRQIYAYVKPEGNIPLQDEPFIINRVANRGDKRLVMKSVKPIHAKMAELENYFYNSLFYTDKTYKELYLECLLWYKSIYDQYSLKQGIRMDEYYFVKLFKPLENEADSI